MSTMRGCQWGILKGNKNDWGGRMCVIGKRQEFSHKDNVTLTNNHGTLG